MNNQTDIPEGYGGRVTQNELNCNDVLKGRGGTIQKYVGNLQYRELIEKYRLWYMSKKTKKSTKWKIANKFVREIRSMNPSGRFLDEDYHNPGTYLEIGDEAARKKSAQAMRERGKLTPEEEEEFDLLPPSFIDTGIPKSEDSSNATCSKFPQQQVREVAYDVEDCYGPAMPPLTIPRSSNISRQRNDVAECYLERKIPIDDTSAHMVSVGSLREGLRYSESPTDSDTPTYPATWDESKNPEERFTRNRIMQIGWGTGNSERSIQSDITEPVSNFEIDSAQSDFHLRGRGGPKGLGAGSGRNLIADYSESVTSMEISVSDMKPVGADHTFIDPGDLMNDSLGTFHKSGKTAEIFSMDGMSESFQM
jgi:hypothetical protein